MIVSDHSNITLSLKVGGKTEFHEFNCLILPHFCNLMALAHHNDFLKSLAINMKLLNKLLQLCKKIELCMDVPYFFAVSVVVCMGMIPTIFSGIQVEY